MISSPFLLIAQNTKPGICVLGLDVAASIAGVLLAGVGERKGVPGTFADARGSCFADLVACHFRWTRSISIGLLLYKNSHEEKGWLEKNV